MRLLGLHCPVVSQRHEHLGDRRLVIFAQLPDLRNKRVALRRHKRTGSLEQRNRLDDVIQFGPLQLGPGHLLVHNEFMGPRRIDAHVPPAAVATAVAAVLGLLSPL